MRFFQSLSRLLRPSDQDTLDPDERQRLLQAWGLSDAGPVPSVATTSESPALASGEIGAVSSYDRTQWVKKLQNLLDALPDQAGAWQDLMADAAALGFDPTWVHDRQVEAFRMRIRLAVADQHVSREEHLILDEARRLIGLSEEEAEAIVQEVVHEAVAFFGNHVDGTT